MTVATAAPIIPHLKTKMKMGSRIMLIAAPANVEIMGFMACPNI